MAQIHFLTNLSYSLTAGWLAHGEQRIVCIIVGALDGALSRMSASWVDSKDSRPTAVLSSVQHICHSSVHLFALKSGILRRSA